jgi:glycosyltransferase involved in cell wall biosynthesis
VELPAHKKILIENGIEEEKVDVTPTPSKIPRKKSDKRYDPNNVNILFASWNNKEGDAVKERGLEFILKILKENPNFTLTIPLRDNDTESFEKIAKELGVWDRVSLLDIHNDIKRLIELFDNSDIVAFVPQKRIVKDVPNSLIDGIVRGKPVIISDVIDFSEVVNNENIGIVFQKGVEPGRLNIDKDTYSTLSENAYRYSEIHSIENYLEVIESAYYENKS